MRLEAAKSVGWTFIEASSAQTILLVIFLILARLLTPAEYGLMALATTVLSVPQFILSNGLIPVIINRESLSDDELSTAFWCSLGIGVFLTLLIVTCSAPLAWLLHNPGLASVLRWSSVSFIFMAVGNVPSALYQRRLQYRVFAIRSVASFLGGGAVGITMALQGYGVWSLVGNLLVQSAISGVVLWVGAGWYPRLRFDPKLLDQIRESLSHTITGNFLASLTTRVDMLIIGWFSSELLGYYYFVQRLLLTISVGTYVPIGNVLLPVLTRERNNMAALRESFVFMLWTAQVLWMPLVAGLGAIAPIMVPNVFGANWGGAVPLLQIISLTAFTTCLYQFTYSALLTVGRASIYTWLTLAQLLLTGVLLISAVRFGLSAVGWAYVAASLATAVIHLLVVRAVLHVAFDEVVARLGSVVAATVAMVLAVLWVGREMLALSPWITLPSQIALGALVYAGVLFAVARSDTSRLTSTVFNLASPTP